MIAVLINFTKKIISFIKKSTFFLKNKVINYLNKFKKIVIQINSLLLIINLIKLIKDPNYAERLISNSSYLSSRHLIIILKISENVIKKKIILLKQTNPYDIKICDHYDHLARNLWYQGKAVSAIKIFDKEEKYRIKIK